MWSLTSPTDELVNVISVQHWLNKTYKRPVVKNGLKYQLMNEMKVLRVLISAILLAICSQKYSPQNILVKKYHTNVKTKSVPLNSV